MIHWNSSQQKLPRTHDTLRSVSTDPNTNMTTLKQYLQFHVTNMYAHSSPIWRHHIFQTWLQHWNSVNIFITYHTCKYLSHISDDVINMKSVLYFYNYQSYHSQGSPLIDNAMMFSFSIINDSSSQHSILTFVHLHMKIWVLFSHQKWSCYIERAVNRCLPELMARSIRFPLIMFINLFNIT